MRQSGVLVLLPHFIYVSVYKLEWGPPGAGQCSRPWCHHKRTWLEPVCRLDLTTPLSHKDHTVK